MFTLPMRPTARRCGSLVRGSTDELSLWEMSLGWCRGHGVGTTGSERSATEVSRRRRQLGLRRLELALCKRPSRKL